MGEINFQLLSDVHLEAPKAYDVFDVPVKAPMLALLGDIGCTTHDELFAFLRAQLSKFQTVFYLLGNHEPYHSTWAESRRRVKDFEADVARDRAAGKHAGAFVFLDQTRFDLSETVTVLGCTLHSHVSAEQEERVSFGLNDFYHIGDWSVAEHNAAHAADAAWLDGQVEAIARDEPRRRVVVFSHHCPTVDARAADPAHRDSPISSGFCTDLAGRPCWSSPSVAVWAFGHTHFNCDFRDEGPSRKRLVTNQRGYYFQQAGGFDASMTLSL